MARSGAGVLGGSLVKKLVLLATLAPFIGAERAHAQLDPEFQLWTAVFLDANRTEPGLAGWLDLHARRSANGVVGIVRPGVGYRFDRSWVVHGGFAWTPVAPDDGELAHVFQLWEQVLWTPAMPAPWSMAWRLRLEERFSTQGDDLALRIRFFGRGAYAIAETPLAVVVWDELFMNLNDVDWGPSLGLAENRLFAGMALLSPDTFRVELGYLNIIQRRPGANDGVLHNIALNVFVGLF